MPRGRGPQHKGARRQFTDEDTLAREVQELGIKDGGSGGGRRKKKDESDDSDESSDDEDKKEAGAAGGSDDENEDGTKKALGVEHLIESENPNRQPAATKSVKKLGTEVGAPELSRREREELQRQRDREAYERLHAQHKTAEAQADLARLAIVRAQREEAAKKREEERQAKEGDMQRRREETERGVAAKPAAVGRGGRSRAKKERDKEKKQQAAAGGVALKFFF